MQKDLTERFKKVTTALEKTMCDIVEIRNTRDAFFYLLTVQVNLINNTTKEKKISAAHHILETLAQDTIKTLLKHGWENDIDRKSTH